MIPEERFTEFIKHLAVKGRGDEAHMMQGKAENVSDTGCDVRLTGSDDLVLTAVQYTATDGNASGFRLVPVEGTNVLVDFMGNDINSPYLVAMDEIAKVLVLASGAELCIDEAGKVTLANSGASLKEIMEDMVSMVKQLTVSTGVGPSGTPLPPTITAAGQIEGKISALFK